MRAFLTAGIATVVLLCLAGATTWYATENNAASTLASGIEDDDTEIDVQAGAGALFPATGDFWLTLTNAAESSHEIVKCTDRTTDAMTIVRAQQGTSAVAWDSADKVELRWTDGNIDAVQDAINDIEDGTTTLDTVTSAGLITGTALTCGAAVMSEADLEQLDGITAGTVTASKALVVDASRDISTLHDLTMDGDLVVTGCDKTWSIWLPVETGIPNTAHPPGESVVQINGSHYQSIASFDKTADEYMSWSFILPEDYDAGELDLEIHWTAIAGTTGDVAWRYYADCYANDGAMGNATLLGVVVDTFLAQDDLHIRSVPFTPTNAVAGGYCNVVIRRYTAHADDDFDADADLLGLQIHY